MGKWVVVWWLLACAAPASAQVPDSVKIRMTPRFAWVKDSLSMESKSSWTEQAVCIGRWEKDGNLLILDKPIPANIVYADSVTTKYRDNDFCGGGCPVMHWHLMEWTTKRTPSPADLSTVKQFSWAPFQLLGIGGTPDMLVYAIRPMPRKVSFESDCKADSA